MSSKLQSYGCYHCQWWWRRLVNVYEVKAGLVCLQCKNCVIHSSERFRGELPTMGCYRNLSPFYIILLNIWYTGLSWSYGWPITPKEGVVSVTWRSTIFRRWRRFEFYECPSIVMNYLYRWIHLQCIQVVDRYTWRHLQCCDRSLRHYNLRCSLHTRRYLRHHTSVYELKPGFHYPRWQPELTARVDWYRFPLPVNSASGNRA